MAEAVRISNATLDATILPHGARLADLRFGADETPLVLGYRGLEDYLTDTTFMGAVIGRYANRIDRGHASIDGNALELERNEGGLRHLHGGTNGFSQRYWDIVKVARNAVVLEINSKDGDSGYPGELRARAIYEVVEDATLRLTLEAHSTKPTPVNLCHHPYFRFGHRTGQNEHILTLNASHYLPSDPDLIPTGEVSAVEGTVYDFRNPTRLMGANGPDFNNTYCLAQSGRRTPHHAATLATNCVRMDLLTTQPGLHFYNGYKLGGGAKPDDAQFEAYSGVCLEAQGWPDSPNHANFPNTVLRPGSTYSQCTEYRFHRLPI